jgi:hypothetical protein
MPNFDAVRKRVAVVARKEARLSADRADDVGVLLAACIGEIRAFDQFAYAPGATKTKVAHAIISRLCAKAAALSAAARLYGGELDEEASRMAATYRRPESALPSVVLDAISWSLQGAPYSSQSEFLSDVAVQQKKLGGDEDWDPDEIVIPCPAIDLRYVYYGTDDGFFEPTVTLTAAEKEGFRAGELLFMVHNAVVEHMEGQDHYFFEGLQLVSQPQEGGRPVYRIHQGS